jgi:hypothetical protein
MKFAFRNHQRKGNAYLKALLERGHIPVYDIKAADYLLIDHDVGRNGQGWNPIVEQAHERGIAVFMYPHAARPMIQWDGMYPAFPHTKCNFVHAEGHAEVMKRYGYPLPVHITGWSYCPIREFRPRKQVKRVLFAPIHPNASGWLCEEDLEVNRKAFEILTSLPIELTVRHIGSLEKSGLWSARRVHFTPGRPDNTYRQVEAFDVVVSYQTFAYLAVALGIPMVGYGEEVVPHSGNYEWNLRWVESWHKYSDIMKFPYDLLTADDPMEMLTEAASTDEKTAEWKKRFIGKPFEPDKFVNILESYL